MKLKTLSAAITLSLVSSAAFSGSYIAEVSVGYADLDNDADAQAISGILYFAPVNTGTHPLAEAAFLEKSSNVELGLALGSMGSADLTYTSIGVNYFVPDTMFFAGAEFNRATIEVGSFDDSETDWGVTAGVIPVEGLLITTSYFNDPGYDLNLNAKYVKALVGDTAINLEAQYIDGDDDDLFGLSVDYYLNKKASIGANIVSADETGYGIQGRYFFNNEFSLAAEYFTVDSNDMIMLEASLRF